MFTRETRDTLQGKSVVISGGSRGIGFSTAQAFLGAGALVAICARDAARLRDAEARLSAGERLLARVGDVTDRAQVQAFVDEAAAAFGPVDVLVNNAGVLHVGPFAEEPVESISTVIDVNLKGVMYMTRAVLPSMIARGKGVIVNVSSGAGLSGFPEIVSYCASKFGVVGFTQALDEEVRSLGLRVYALCPGRVATEMQAQYSGAKVGMTPEKVAHRILELATATPSLLPGRCVVTSRMIRAHPEPRDGRRYGRFVLATIPFSRKGKPQR
jgi:3-oxoacyl-[acyl-carrier protein] reductase